MLKTQISHILFFLSCTMIYSQSNKAVYVELLGNGLIASANFDMRFSKKQMGWEPEWVLVMLEVGMRKLPY